jgi:hypothetical protein
MAYRKSTLLAELKTKENQRGEVGVGVNRQIVLRIGRRSSKTYTTAQEVLNLWLSL